MFAPELDKLARSKGGHYPIERHTLLKRSFVHIKGLGPRAEASLWRQGIASWDDLRLEAPRLYRGSRLELVIASLDQALAAWDRADLHYFHTVLPGNERWRLVQGAFADVAYLDIEATGGRLPPASQSTAVGCYFRGEMLQEHDYARKRDLIAYILEASPLLCSYNGGGYDIPFLRAEFGFAFATAHVDLCPWLRRQGFKGGLKAIQRSMPHLHQRSSLDIDGYDAVRLWRLHELGVPGALATLLTYNAEDVLVLEPLLVEAYNREVEARPQLGLALLKAPELSRLTTAIDPGVYALLRARTDWDAHDPLGYLESLGLAPERAEDA